MATLFLGKVGAGRDIFEIHALTNGHGFREIAKADISDPSLYRQILKGRYQMLTNGNAIYCTAVNPIIEEEIEYNPHDDREGTVHFVAVDRHGEVEAALAVAVDIGAKDNGVDIGVPLENKWKSGEYSIGENLDDFRSRYVRLNHDEDRDILPYEMAELCRHYKRFGTNNTFARLGLYCGLYQLLVREAYKKRQTPTTLWVFNAIPHCFNHYRYTGAAVLRDYTIQDTPQFISPAKKELEYCYENKMISLSYKGMMISRNVVMPIPVRENGTVRHEKKNVPFLDGIIDISNVEKAAKRDPKYLSPIYYKGFNGRDKLLLNNTISLLARRA